MNFTIRHELQFAFDDKDICIESTMVASFFEIEKDEMHTLIKKLNRKKIFTPVHIYSWLSHRDILSLYRINGNGCKLLLKHIDAPKERKQRFLYLLGINKFKNT